MRQVTVMRISAIDSWDTEDSLTLLRTASDRTMSRVNKFEIHTKLIKLADDYYDEEYVGWSIDFIVDLTLAVKFADDIRAAATVQPVYHVRVEHRDEAFCHSWRDLSWNDVTTGLELLDAALKSEDGWIENQQLLKAAYKTLMERKGAWKHSLK